MQSCGGQPEIKMKLKPDLSLTSCFGGAMGTIVMFSVFNAWGKRCCCVVGALLRVSIRGPGATLGTSDGLKVQWVWAESELRCSAYKWHHSFLVTFGAKVGCGLHVSQLQSRKELIRNEKGLHLILLAFTGMEWGALTGWLGVL